MFSYLLIQRSDRKAKAVEKMLKEAKAILLSSTTEQLKSFQLTVILNTISHYKVAIYSASKVISTQLELNKVSDLLTEIISWETETCSDLTKISLKTASQKAPALPARN